MPRGNDQLAFPSHQERYDTSRPLPPDKKFTLIVEATIRCVVLHQCVVDSKFIKYPSVVIVRGKTIIGPQSILSFTSPAAKMNQIRCERSFVRIHCLFRRMFSFRHFSVECTLRRNKCRIFSASINDVQTYT